MNCPMKYDQRVMVAMNCTKENCGWYDEHKEQCSVLSIAQAVTIATMPSLVVKGEAFNE